RGPQHRHRGISVAGQPRAPVRRSEKEIVSQAPARARRCHGSASPRRARRRPAVAHRRHLRHRPAVGRGAGAVGGHGGEAVDRCERAEGVNPRGRADSSTMAEINSHPLLATDTVAVWDVLCSGTCRHKSNEEYVSTTPLVFPYRGVFVRHGNQVETVAEANQVVFFNENEPYRVSHPVGGGDASLSIGIDEATLLELAPADVL